MAALVFDSPVPVVPGQEFTVDGVTAEPGWRLERTGDGRVSVQGLTLSRVPQPGGGLELLVRLIPDSGQSATDIVCSAVGDISRGALPTGCTAVDEPDGPYSVAALRLRSA